MFQFNFNTPGGDGINILCLGAHCDDIEIGCGGTLLKLIQRYNVGKVLWIVFASNETRRREALASAERFLSEVEIKEINILSYRDAFIDASKSEIKLYYESIKERINPDIIFTHYRNDRHQDHRLVSDLTWNTFRDHLILEYEIPKYDGDLDIPNSYSKLNGIEVNKKVQILLECFKSQQSKHWFDEETFRALMRIRGLECASQYAEAFHVRKWLI